MSSLAPNTLRDLDELVTKLRSLGVSHARIGDVELWLDPVKDAPATVVRSTVPLPRPETAQPPVEPDGIVWTEDEQELIP